MLIEWVSLFMHVGQSQNAYQVGRCLLPIERLLTCKISCIRYGGSGLGLFICRRIAQLLGGEIDVTSEPGRGSTFRFYIPTQRCDKPGTETEVDNGGKPMSNGHASLESKDPAAEPPAPEKMRVLLVEDNLVNQQILARLLTKKGCECQVANDGSDAMDKLRTSRWMDQNSNQVYDCVLMDIEVDPACPHIGKRSMLTFLDALCRCLSWMACRRSALYAICRRLGRSTDTYRCWPARRTLETINWQK